MDEKFKSISIDCDSGADAEISCDIGMTGVSGIALHATVPKILVVGQFALPSWLKANLTS